MNIIDIKVPDIGNGIYATVAEIYFHKDMNINIDDNILMLETDKSAMEIPSEYCGIVQEVLVKVGDKVKTDDIILKMKINDKELSNNPNDIKPSNLQHDVALLEIVSDFSCDLLVIGGGPGGYAAAFRAADLGQNVILIERDSVLGGVCLNVGCVPSKTLLHIAKVINEVNYLKDCKILTGDIAYDITKIVSHKNNIINQFTTGLAQLAAKRNIQIIYGNAFFVDNNVVKIESNNSVVVKFTNAIIATGSYNRELDLLNNAIKSSGIKDQFDTKRIMYSTEALNLNDIPQKLLIIGGGVIGLEMAEIYNTLGSEVTVVEAGNNILCGVDHDLINILSKSLTKKNIKVYTNATCINFDTLIDGISVMINNNGTNNVMKFDKILIAIGRLPNSINLNLQNIGVKLDAKDYIVINDQCQTNINNIYAIGDVVGQPMLAHKASYEGKIAAQNCAGSVSYRDASVIPNVAYTNPEISWVGVTENAAAEQQLAVNIAKFPRIASARAASECDVDGFTKIICDKTTGKIIGGAIVGLHASELIAEITLAIEMGCSIDDIALTIHPHPTLSEGVALTCEILNETIVDLAIK